MKVPEITDNSIRELRRISRRYLLQWLLFGLAALLLGGYIGQVLYADYKRIEIAERDRLLTQTKVVAQNLGQQLSAAAGSLGSIRDDLPVLNAQKYGGVLINRRMQAMANAMPGARTIVILDAAGKLIASNREELIGLDLAEREYFQVAHRERIPERLYVSPPFKTALGVYAINVTKVLQDKRGAFDGVISVTLDPEYFSTLLDSIRYAPDMLSSLIHGDGNIIFRVPDTQGIVGMNLAKPGSFFTQHIKSGREFNTFTGTVASTGESRLTVFRTIQPAKLSMDRSLVIVTSREMSSLYAHWRDEAYKQGALFGILLLSTGLSLFFFQWRKRAFDRIAADLENERRTSEQQLRITATVFESKEGMIVTDANEVILRVNRAFSDITGYSAAEAVGNTPRILKSTQQDAAFYAAMWKSIQNTGGWRGRIWNRHKNGDVYPEWLTITAVRDADGAIINYVGTIADITERERMEEALRKSEQRLRIIVETEPECVMIIDRDGQLLEMNQAGLAMLEAASMAEAQQHSLVGFLLPKYRPAFMDLHLRVTHGASGMLAFEIEGLKGTRRWLETHAAPMRNTAGEVVSLLGVTRDITAHKQAEQALIESEARFRNIFRENGSVMLLIDPTNSKIVDANSAASTFYGYPAEQLVGMYINQINVLPPEKIAEEMKRAVLAKRNYFIFEHRLASGEIRDTEVYSTPIIVGGTKVLLSIVHDITARKETERVRAQLEAQLRESQKMEALGTLAGGVAHDFNNALAMIIGNVELARQDVGSDHPALVSLEEISKASRRAKDLVQQILAFGRRQNMERKPTSLALVVVESARLIRATLPVGVSLNVICEPDAPAVLADATQVKQMLLNLCSNAAQAVEDQGRPGVIEIRLSGHSADSEAYMGPERRSGRERTALSDGLYACLIVKDNGPGMDEATRSRIFEPFFTTKPVGKGTGLGLSVVHGIVQGHEAYLEVESAPEQGSEFRVYFPAIDAPVEVVETSAAGSAIVHGEGKRILYVDDEEAIIFLMTRLLERKGYRVSGYTDPRDALAAVRANPDQFDLVVTDYNMPGMSGLDVATALREVRADLPVVLASGYITEELRQKAPAAGVRDLIYKPNTADDLCEAVARYANAQGKVTS